MTLKTARNVGSGCIVMALTCEIFFKDHMHFPIFRIMELIQNLQYLCSLTEKTIVLNPKHSKIQI